MYSLQSKPMKLPSVQQRVGTRNMKPRAMQGIGDVVHVNVYETLTQRLDSIEDKLVQIETYLNVEPVVKDTEPMPEPYVMTQTPAPVSSGAQSKKLLDLQAQMAEATSEARRNALQARILELSARS